MKLKILAVVVLLLICAASVGAEGTRTDTAGENLSKYNLCYRGADSKLYKADASDTTKMPAIAMAAANIAANASGKFYKIGAVSWPNHGLVSVDSWQLIYASTTLAGAATGSRPTTGGHLLQIVGQIIDGNNIIFNPNLILIEVAGVPGG